MHRWHSFVGMRLHDGRMPPAYSEGQEKFYICSDGSHTHTNPLPQEGGKIRPGQWDEMRMKREWGWDENEDGMKNYLTGTRDGQRKRRKEEGETPTPTHLAHNGQTLKGKGKRKAEADGNGPRPAEGGEDGRAWTNLPRRNLSLPKHGRTQTYLERAARMKLGTNED